MSVGSIFRTAESRAQSQRHEEPRSGTALVSGQYPSESPVAKHEPVEVMGSQAQTF